MSTTDIERNTVVYAMGLDENALRELLMLIRLYLDKYGAPYAYWLEPIKEFLRAVGCDADSDLVRHYVAALLKYAEQRGL